MNRHAIATAVAATAFVFASTAAADTIEFLPGQWDPNRFMAVKSSRFDHIGTFIQEFDHIVNYTPPTASPQELQGKLAGRTYSAMVLRTPFTGRHEFSSRMSFDYRMAPIIVLAAEPATLENGVREFRAHYEVVLWDEGINVWHHHFVDGKQKYELEGQLKTMFKQKTYYKLKVAVVPEPSPHLEIEVLGHELSVPCLELPGTYYAGIIGCEGTNRFRDFRFE